MLFRSGGFLRLRLSNRGLARAAHRNPGRRRYRYTCRPNGFPARKVNEIAGYIKDFQPITGVLVAYGKIIPQSIIDLFSPGIINVHPSLLPKYRGPSPIESAIINRDNETGVSIMKLDAQMDAGPIYAQIHKKLSGTETKPQLYNELFSSGSELLISILPQ